MVMEYFLQNSYQSLKNHCASFKQVIFTLILFFKLLWNLNDIEGYSIKELCHSVATVEKSFDLKSQCGNFMIFLSLREIKFGDSGSTKSAILKHLEYMNFDFYAILHLLKAEIVQTNKLQSSKMAKKDSFRTSTFSKIVFT